MILALSFMSSLKEETVNVAHESRGRLEVRKLPVKLDRNVRRVVTLPFGVATNPQGTDIFRRVGRLSDEEVERTLETVLEQFAGRHEHIEERFEEHFQMASKIARKKGKWARARRLLIGSYLTMEYSIEAAALFNPSIVPHPDQSGVADGSQRFIMSLRAVGEGHLSSTVFQTGIVSESGEVTLDPSCEYSARTEVKPDREYLKSLFGKKLDEMGVHTSTAALVLDLLPEKFTFDELDESIEKARTENKQVSGLRRVAGSMRRLARANYQLQLKPDDDISDLILFPRAETEARGIEDMRLVRFVDDDGAVIYYGTYTAYDGEHILPMLMETRDFRTINIHTLNGDCVQNKGMALFPRRIGGHYAMCSRIDGRNLFLMFSDYVHFWESAALLAEPKYPWELRIMGNCGSPIETREGWLLITHGVGPMRRYCISAMLLDLEDSFQIRGRLREPLLAPAGEEREGYVPNVVYSCGSMIHAGRLIVPYAVSDTASRIATVDLEELLGQLLRDGP